jgi:hypothetical protein
MHIFVFYDAYNRVFSLHLIRGLINNNNNNNNYYYYYYYQIYV